MTDKTEAKATRTDKWGSLTASIIATVAILAVFTWLAGIALNKGFGVHVPFVAGLILLGVGLSVIKTAASEVASSWHSRRIRADIHLLAATMAAQDSLKEQQLGGLDAFLRKLDHPDDESSAYL